MRRLSTGIGRAQPRCAEEEGLNNQVVPFLRGAPPIPRHARNAAEIHGFCAAVSEVRIHLPPAKSLQTISSSAAEPITADGSNAARPSGFLSGNGRDRSLPCVADAPDGFYGQILTITSAAIGTRPALLVGAATRRFVACQSRF